MVADGSVEPTPLLERTEASEVFFNVSWPKNDAIYYAHFAPSVDDLGAVVYGFQIERLPYPEGEPEVLVEAAAWPRVSYDGRRMVYVTDANELFVANDDGSNPTLLLDSDAFPAMDAPLFSPDGNMIYFSAIEPEQAARPSIWDLLMGTVLD